MVGKIGIFIPEINTVYNYLSVCLYLETRLFFRNLILIF